MAQSAAPAVVVLIAEDETLVRLYATETLQEAGYQVFDARDGQEALTVLEVRGDAVRALVSDIAMPSLDGLSLAKIVSARWPHIGIVLTSGYPPAELHDEMPPGARFLRKPYRPDNLVRELEAMIGDDPAVSAPVALHSIPTMQPGHMHGAGGLAQPLAEPDE